MNEKTEVMEKQKEEVKVSQENDRDILNVKNIILFLF